MGLPIALNKASNQPNIPILESLLTNIDKLIKVKNEAVRLRNGSVPTSRAVVPYRRSATMTNPSHQMVVIPIFKKRLSPEELLIKQELHYKGIFIELRTRLKKTKSMVQAIIKDIDDTLGKESVEKAITCRPRKLVIVKETLEVNLRKEVVTIEIK